jgi:hypothetical protein
MGQTRNFFEVLYSQFTLRDLSGIIVPSTSPTSTASCLLSSLRIYQTYDSY